MPDIIKTIILAQYFEGQSSKLVEEAQKDAQALKSKSSIFPGSALLIKPLTMTPSDDEGQKWYLLN